MTEAHDIKRNIMPCAEVLSHYNNRSLLNSINLRVCVGSLILVARMCDNCDAHCYCCLFVMNMSSILIVPKVFIVARYSCSIQNNSSDGINWCKACHTANLHTL